MNKLLPLAAIAGAAVIGRQGRRAKGGYTRASIRKLGYTDAQINRALAALERTPSGRDAGPKGAVVATPPKAVRDAAYKGLKIRAQMPKSRQGGTDIGVGRAIQLALGQPLPERSIKRMRAYFSRHARDFRPGWDAPGDESKGYIAWLLWGGTPGRTWAEKQYKGAALGLAAPAGQRPWSGGVRIERGFPPALAQHIVTSMPKAEQYACTGLGSYKMAPSHAPWACWAVSRSLVRAIEVWDDTHDVLDIGPFVVQGYFDGVEDWYHEWVELEINGETWIVDGTASQFAGVSGPEKLVIRRKEPNDAEYREEPDRAD